MRIASYNIKGLGGRIKRRVVRNLIRTERIDFICIQETKLENIEELFCQ